MRDAVAAAAGGAVEAALPVGGGCVDPAWRLRLAHGPDVFVKAGDGPGAHDRYRAEAGGLRWLGAARAVGIPEVLAVGSEPPGPAFLALAWIEPGRPGPHADEALGRSLAALHRFGAPGFGLASDGFIGPLPQPNGALPTWAAFLATRRLEPLVRRCVERGILPREAGGRLDRLVDRLDDLVGPVEPPARLHGDLWAGNVLVGTDGRPWLVDPAAYGGHRETDLAMLRLFGGPGPRTLAAYHEVFPLAEGHEDRVELNQLYPLLVHALLFGGGYPATALRILRRLG
ncbi:MAG: fructosamine kinase family protein [Acidimicrobiales bacterium]|nr:fructosamine kinase family protein [Acidimicrobiales bacterium]